MGANAVVGRDGEEIAVQHLEQLGYVVLARNGRCGAGELDIVARAADGTLCFVEVKTRTGLDYGVPAEAVTRRKAQRIRGLAQQWLAEVRPPYAALRFDVVSIVRPRRGAFLIEHFQGAF